ncbi:DUF418 domain-containing protein [Streptomyces flavofungini]|uniref:DUF418 domain-containing protein n=1 Tax=Streptomyces flavofungini TaxID=68200 RepID=UPI0025AEE8BC|nr:DUF418 domain-containing protein [Streptomyces flavofungini]WJV47981.1 DUF418 domain-containing protein [Streptomyces flavofungini]
MTSDTAAETTADKATRPVAPRPTGVRATERALAPDLARGLMLLFIAMSNTAFHLWNADHGPSGWQPVNGGWLDHTVQFAMIVGLDLRIYPLFAFLFGYGMMQLYLRQTASGTSERKAAALLRKRSLWMVVIGLTHAGLLMAGDIIGFYGLLSLGLGWLFLRRGDRALKWWIWISVTVTVAAALQPVVTAAFQGELGSLGDAGADAGSEAYGAGEESWLAAAGTRMTTAFYLVGLAAPLVFVTGGGFIFLLGFWAARRRILEEPGKHLKLLRGTAVIGIAIGWLGGLPAALAHVGALDVPPDAESETGALTALRDVTGSAAGLGYVAVVALFVHWWTRRQERRREAEPGPATAAAGSATTATPTTATSTPVATAVTAISAVGKRSLSCYLTHSLLFAPVLAAWGLGLGEHLTSATMALFAFGVWLVTVAGAYALEIRGKRGPAETLLRRLMYGKRT